MIFYIKGLFLEIYLLGRPKSLKISYDWRGMPVEFLHETGDNSKDYKLLMAYDGSGRRISKTRYSKNVQYGYWTQDVVTHYTGIGTEVREAMRRSASPKTTVVVNLPQGLGRYLPEDAEKAAGTAIPLDKDGKPVFMGEATPEFEWYLKNHLGSTMLVYGTQPYNDKYSSYAGGVKAAYDYRAFGEQVDLAMPAEKVTENFTGKEKDDETELNYFGARYLDPMLGMWTSVDPKRQFSSPYLYAGNGYNPVNVIDPDGEAAMVYKQGNNVSVLIPVIFSGESATPENIALVQNTVASKLSGNYGKYNLTVRVVALPEGANGGDPSGLNSVQLLNKNGPSCRRESCAHLGREGAAEINMSGKNALFDIMHEFAHLMGLEDKYNDKTGEVFEGYENNLMGTKNGFDLLPSQIEEMWTPNSKNGSEGNFIYEE